jgi:predicted metal-binding membrane protein
VSSAASERQAPVWPALLLVAVAGGCWAVTVERMQGMDMGPGTELGGLGSFAVVWVTMMAAMMLPSVAPIAVAHSRGAGAVVFAAGYLLAWAAFGLLAYAFVDAVRSLDLGFLAWDSAGRYVAGGMILGAALYELTGAKARFLRHCRDSRLLRMRPGVAGTLSTGIEQGGFCIGCSGGLMAALFALGVMSITWMLLIAAAVALEKLLPWSVLATGLTAATLAVLGVAVIVVPHDIPSLTIPM